MLQHGSLVNFNNVLPVCPAVTLHLLLQSEYHSMESGQGLLHFITIMHDVNVERNAERDGFKKN